METQFITDGQGNKLGVFLPIKSYNQMMKDLEELEEVKSYDEAKKGEQVFLDAQEVFFQIENKRKSKNV